jgi:hypothetical protein
VLCAVVSRASAEQQNAEGSKADIGTIGGSSEAIAPLLVNSDQGLAIIGAALEFRKPTDFNADCSNLVHAIYERAGFPYSYSNSSELYRGIKDFRRVLHPQPGDLVVWLGHVGIVISPVQHSFFSAMRSGRGIDFYDSPYWQERGPPHFFRYLKAASRTRFPASIRNANLKPASSRADPPPALPEIEGTQPASLHKSQNQTTSEAKSATDRKQMPVSHKIQGPGDGVWEKTATKPSPEIPFDAAVTPTRRDEPLTPQSLRTSNNAAKAGPAGAKTPSEGGPPVHESSSEPVQWAMSRYVPRPPWSSSSGRTSEPSVPRPPTKRVPRASQGS